jgi:hypothetical protein
MVETMRRKRDEDGADTWPRIAASTTLASPPSDARH